MFWGLRLPGRASPIKFDECDEQAQELIARFKALARN